MTKQTDRSNPQPDVAETPAPVARRRRGPWRALLFAFVLVYFIAGAAFLLVRHWVWPNLDSWRPQIEQRLAQALAQPVKLGAFQTDFDRFRPRLYVQGLKIGGEAGKGGFELRGVEALLSWRSLLTGEPVLDSLRIIEPTLDVVRHSQTRFSVSGVELDLAAGSSEGGLSNWLLNQHSIRIQQARLRYRDARSDLSAELVNVDITIGGVGRRHRVSVSGSGQDQPDGLSAPVRAFELAAELYRLSHGVAERSRQWGGKVFLVLDQVDTQALQALTELHTPIEQGRGNVKLWLDFDAGRPSNARAELDLADLHLRTADGLAALNAVSASTSATWRADGSIELLADRLKLVGPSGKALAVANEAQRLVFDSNAHLVAARVSLAAAPVDEILQFAKAMPLPAPLAERIARWRLGGQLERVALDWREPAKGAPLYAVDVEFNDLSFDASDARAESHPPGFRSVSGRAHLHANGGELHLAGRDATLSLPGLFEQPDVALDSYEALARWQRSSAQDGEPALRVDIAHFEFANADAAGRLAGSWQPAEAGPGKVDLTAKLSRADGRRVWRYLPARLPQPVRDWVRRSIDAGQSDDVKMLLRGDLYHFPFRDPALGDFQVDARVADGRLDFAPGWPAIESIEGRLRFARGGLRLDAERAQVFGVVLDRIAGELGDFRKPELHLEGHGKGPAADMLNFVLQSPIHTIVPERVRQMRIDGPAELTLALDLPIANLRETQVNGRVGLAENRLVLDPQWPTIESLAGQLGFTRAGLRFENMQAKWLGGPVSGEGGPDADGNLRLRFAGVARPEGLAWLIGAGLSTSMSGQADYAAQLLFDKQGPRLRVDGELERLAVNMPAPLGKPAGTRRALAVMLDPLPAQQAGQVSGDRIRVQAESQFALLLERSRNPSDGVLSLQRGALALGQAPQLPVSGLALQIRADDLDLDQWRNFGVSAGFIAAATGLPTADSAPAPAGAASALQTAGGFRMPDLVSIVAQQARLGGKIVESLVLGASRDGERWHANVKARQLDGALQWFPAEKGSRNGKLQARFARLEVPESRAGELGTLIDQAPRQLPALDITADSFVLGKRELGRLELLAHPGVGERWQDWNIDRLRIMHPGAQLDATGQWAAVSAPAQAAGAGGNHGQRSTSLDFKLQVADAGQLLAALGFPETVRGGIGRFDGGIRWLGAPMALDLPSLSGELHLDIGKGQFLKTDPGIAKLIGVINLQSLPRRLSLDFRDVFAQGFAFDEIRGTAALLRGVARTENMQMNGVQARVGIRGQVDLNRETQALLVEVRPQLDAGLASLAYAAMVNPAIGLGSFLAQMLLQKPLAELLTYEYRVDGDWADPQVVERSRRVLGPEEGQAQILQ